MIKKRLITIGAINIVMPAPHSPERYISMFTEAGKLENTVRLRGDWVGRLGSIRQEKDSDKVTLIHGYFYKYIELDATKEWFNVQSRKPAGDIELESISIPSHLKPHFQYVPFIFFSKGHRLILVTKDGQDSVSPLQAMAILKGAFLAEELTSNYGNIEVTVEPARETLNTILSMPRLRALDIEITPPNPDDLDEFEHELFGEMTSQQAKSYRMEMRAEDGRELVPNEKTKNLAKVAQSNGKVVGVGGEIGRTKRLSTVDHPFVEKLSYNPDLELRPLVFLTKAREIFQGLVT